MPHTITALSYRIPAAVIMVIFLMIFLLMRISIKVSIIVIIFCSAQIQCLQKLLKI